MKPGDVVAWRNCTREMSGRHAPSYATAMRVVRDAPGELVLFRGPGYPMRRRNADLLRVDGLRHQPIQRHRDGWTVEPEWGRWDVLLRMDPDGHHAVSLFRDAATGATDFWYVDVIGPVTRTGSRLDFVEHGLDAVIEPDFSAWRLKDADELEWSVEHGMYERAEADSLYEECKRGVHELLDEPARFREWLSWRPDPAWQVTRLPEGWDVI